MTIEKIKTNDESETYFNPEVGESYHSTSGALEEARMKFAEPCLVRKRAKTGKLKILDFCFGLGYNSAVAVDAALRANPDCKIEIVGLENDHQIIEKIQEVNPIVKNYQIFKKLRKTKEGYYASEGNIQSRVIIGDAAKKIKNLNEKFDCIFFDPFSPKKQPELWTKEVFLDVKRLMDNKGVLATYSCARIVRENLTAAGFIVSDGPCVGRRGPSTIATLN